MKTKLLVLAALLFLALGFSVQAQVERGPYYFGGHTYYVIEPKTLEAMQATASAMGGHIIFMDSEEEFGFLNSLNKRGIGWFWGGASLRIDPSTGRNAWINDDDTISLYSQFYLFQRHKVRYYDTFAPANPNARIMYGYFQIIPRSTKWTTMVSRFDPDFYSRYEFRAVIEIDSQ